MSDLCVLIVDSLKVVIVIALVWLMAWGAVGGFQWWSQKKNDEGYWDMWIKWLIISIVVLVVIMVVYAMLPTTVCLPVEEVNYVPV